jgi:peptide/nickel transport system ATP-binding protein
MNPFRRQVQIILQDPRSSLNPQLTVAQVIREPLEGLGFQQDHQQRINYVLQQVELELAIKSQYPHQLSGGQCQRVAIARALAAEPSVLIADEPVSALDVLVREEILQLLARLIKDLGLTLVLISHDLSVIARLCNTVVVMQQGQIVESGTTLSVFNSPRLQFTKDLISAVPRIATLKN